MSSILGEVPSSTGVPPPPPGSYNPPPTWTQKEKKRVIPSHLAPKRKPGFHVLDVASSKSKNNSGRDRSALSSVGNPDARNTSNAFTNNDSYNIMSFGSRRLFDHTKSGYDDTIHDTLVSDDVTTADQDLPPTKLLHDLNADVLDSEARQNHDPDAFSNRDPASFKNIFNPKPTKDESAAPEPVNHDTPSQQDLAVLVFGYPESHAGQIIQHFKDFGDILEDFDVSKAHSASLLKHSQRKNSASVPILCGELWIKITYKSPRMAMDALQENGSVFNGSLLGVIPYSKSCVEKLEKRVLLLAEDIGGLKVPLDTGIDLNNTKPSTAGISSLFSKLDIKDGSNLFLALDGETNKPSQKEQLGLLGKMSRYFFGFNDL